MKRQSPIYILLIIAASIFLAEAVVMLLFSAFPRINPIVEIIIDPVILIMFVSPVLYFFLFRPLVLYVRELRLAEEKLKKHQDMLEGLVEVRTAEARASEEKYRKLIETSTDAIVSVNERREVIQWNNAAAKIFGYTEGEMIGNSIDVIVPEEYKERHIKGFSVFLETGKAGSIIGKTAEVEGLRKDGSRIPVELSLSTLKIDGFNSITGIMRDITHRKQAEAIVKRYSGELEEKVAERTQKLEGAYKEMEKMVRIIEKSTDELRQKNVELEIARELAEEGSRAKSVFLANMSHELRTPLNAIIGFSEVMISGMAGPLTEEQREFLNDIYESGNRLLSMINSTLEFSQLESVSVKLKYSVVDAKELIEESLAMFKEDMDRHRLKLDADIESSIGTIEADRDRIKQVLVNLLSNAVKFTPDGGSVRVSARKIEAEKTGSYEVAETNISSQALNFSTSLPAMADRDFIEISVADTGIGISDEDKIRLFTMFQQLEKHLTKKYSGIGIGLVISKRIIDLHKGHIRVESEVGKGSRFVFSIPVKQVMAKEVNA